MNSELPEPFPNQIRKTSRLAISSFIMGTASLPLFFATIIFIIIAQRGMIKAIHSVLLFGVFFPMLSIIAIVFGVAAIGDISKSSNLTGFGLALAGTVGASLTFLALVLLWGISIS